MKKRFLAFLLSGAMLLSTMPAAFAAETITIEDSQDAVTVQDESTGESTATSGTCGEALTWSYDNGILTISGTGAMSNYSSENEPPWYDMRDSITAVVVTDGVTAIGNDAFEDCDNLTSVNMADSVTSIGNWAFYSCGLTGTIEIPDGVTSIGRRAFGYGQGVTGFSVSGDNTAYSSEDGVLFNKNKTELIQYPVANSRTEYEIPNTVTTIADAAFENAKTLTSVTIPDSVITIGNDAFGAMWALTSVNIPESVTSIGSAAFWNTKITSVTIPESVTSIGSGAFEICDEITEFIVDSNNTKYSSEDGVLFDKDKTVLIQYPVGSSRTEYEIPYGVTRIQNTAFMDCYTTLQTVTVPASVTYIGRSAFEATGTIAIKFCGDAPELMNSPFNITKATLYYPSGNSTWTEEFRQSVIDKFTSEHSTIKFQEWDAPANNIQTETKPKDENGNEVEGNVSVTVDTDENSSNSAQTAIANSSTVTKDEITEALSSELAEGTTIEEKDGQFVTSDDETVSIDKSVKIEVSATVNSASNEVAFEVTPYVITTATINNTTVTVKQEEIHEVSEPVKMTLTLPTGFAKVGDTVYVTHKASGGNKFYEATVQQNDSGELYITFVNEDGFSEFIVTADDPQKDCKAGNHTAKELLEVAPTCNKTGLTAGEECSICGTVLKAQDIIPATGEHTYDSGKVTQQPTTTQKGVKTYTCTVCGATKTSEIPVVVDSHTHSYTEKVTKEATCTDKGTKTLTCSCGDTKTEEIPAKGHNAVSVKATAPTCTENGLTAGTKCSVCGEVIKAQETVKALGHTSVTDPLVKATTKKDGKTEGSHCSTCGEIIKAQQTIYKASKIKLSKKSYRYNGKKHKPKVIVTDAEGNTVDKSNYTVKYYGNRKKVGKYKVTVTLKGDQYKGKKTLYFTVRKK